MMDSILSVNMYYSEKMRALVDLSNMTVDPSDSNSTCSEDSNHEEIMWHIQSFEKIQKEWSVILCGLWEASFFSSDWVYLNLDYNSWLCFLSCKVIFWHPYPFDINF